MAMWLFMAAAEAYPPLHAWLHGGAIPDDDDCPIAMIHQGKLDNTVIVITVVVFVRFAISIQAALSSQFVPYLPLPSVRGPPMYRLAIAPH